MAFSSKAERKYSSQSQTESSPKHSEEPQCLEQSQRCRDIQNLRQDLKKLNDLKKCKDVFTGSQPIKHHEQGCNTISIVGIPNIQITRSNKVGAPEVSDNKTLHDETKTEAKYPVDADLKHLANSQTSRLDIEVKKSPSDNQVVFSKPKDQFCDVINKYRERSTKALRENNIASPFLATTWFRGSRHFITQYANFDSLDIFIKRKKNKLPIIEVQKLLAQLILALEVLHKHNLIHFDIKPENIFVFKRYDGSFQFILGDYDGLTKNEDALAVSKNGGILASKAYLPSSYSYSTDNHKARDYFCLGKTIQALIPVINVNDDLIHFGNQLLNYQKNARNKELNTSDLKNHPLFGQTPEARNELFKKVAAEAETFYIDDFYNPNLEFEDAFNFLPKPIKDIIVLGEELLNLINHFDVILEKTKIKSFPEDKQLTPEQQKNLDEMHCKYHPVELYELIKKKYSDFLRKTEEATMNAGLKAFHSELTTIKTNLTDFKNKHTQNLDSIIESHKPYLQTLNEKIIRSWNKKKENTSQLKNLLIEKATNMVNEYSKLHGEKPKTLFSRHDVQGVERAKQLLKKINNENDKNIPDSIKLKAIYKIIYEFLQGSDGNWGKESRKSLLMKHLSEIDHFKKNSLEVIYHRLIRTPPPKKKIGCFRFGL